MLTRDEHRLNRQFDRLALHLPRWLGNALRWLRKPSSRFIRVPAALLLMLGGVFGFLPILGLWMLPLGLLLLAQDVPLLRRPMRRLLLTLERRWKSWKRRRKSVAAC